MIIERQIPASCISSRILYGLLSAGLGLVFSTTVRAQDLRPIEAHSIVLGDVAGVVYYTAEADGFRVVATVGGVDDASPIRFIATLAPEQAAVISVPRGVGRQDAEVTFIRHGDRLTVLDRRVAMR